MNKQNETKVFAQIDDLLARWRKEMTEPTTDKPELAEEGINQLYKRAGKKPPLILWCDSPLQTMLIPTLVANVLSSDGWKTLVENMGSFKDPASEQYLSQWKSQWIKVEKNTVLPLLERIWNFQFKKESSFVQQKVLDRLNEHLFTILKDGRLNATSINQKPVKKPKNLILPGPAHVDMWTRFSKLAAEIQLKTSTEFNVTVAAVQGVFFGVVDHRPLTKHIPIVSDLVKPSEQQKDLLERIQQVRAKCTELERISTTRAALLTEASSGFVRPVFVPDVDPKSEWTEVMWKNFNAIKSEMDLRLLDPRASGLILWGASASWLPLALSSRMLDSSILAGLEVEIDSWAYMFHGALGYYLGDTVCFVCRKPKTLVTNDSGRLHSSFGAAATWSDGFDIHCWRGITVDEDLIKRAHEIKINEILTEENAEMRRILLDMFGEERFVQESGATIIDQDQYGVLYKYAFKSDEPLLMVRVRNSTRELDGSYKNYYLRVPPNMTTAKQAVAWTFELTASEYAPGYQS